MTTYKGQDINLEPTQGMAEEARRFLAWKKEGRKGGTEVALARAKQLRDRRELSPKDVRDMHSFFSRHEKSSKGATGFAKGDEGYPSPGRVAWAAWGGDAGQTWARGKASMLDRIDEETKSRALEDDFPAKTLTALRNKVEEHNEKHGDTKSKRVSLGMLAKVYKKGVGAYNTNPGSVRPSVTSQEQWAMARVNSFLYAVRNGKFKSGKHDTDLLPEGHPMSTEEKRNQDLADEAMGSSRMEDRAEDECEARHVVDVVDGDDTVTVVYAKKHEEDDAMPDMDGRPYHDDDDEDEAEMGRFDRTKMQYRSFGMFDKVIDEKSRTVRVGVSSEQQVQRLFGKEVIDHRRKNMDLSFLGSGRAPVLLDHRMDQQIGVVESVELDEQTGRLRALLRFGKGKLASEVFNDVLDGIRQNISVGYKIKGRVEREGDASDVYRIATAPFEISVVSVPSDKSNLVGVGRSDSKPIHAKLEIEERKDKMSEQDLDAVRAEATEAAEKELAKRHSEIMDVARRHNRADLGQKAIAEGTSLSDFRGLLLHEIGNNPLDAPAAAVDVPVKEQRGYSITRAIRAESEKNWDDAGYEREISDEIRIRSGKTAQGFYVPDFAWRSGPMATAATGAVSNENVVSQFIPTDHRGDLFIAALRNKLVMASLGVNFMGGLTTKISMPKFSAGANAAFVAELANVADQSQTAAAVELQPRTMGAFVDIGRLALKQSIPALDQVVTNDLLISAAQLIESIAITGTGNDQPTGILNASGVGDVDISSDDNDVADLTWADITNLVQTVETANGVVDGNALGWLSNPAVKAKMSRTPKVASTDSVMLLNDPWNELYGYKAEFTSAVPSNLDPGDSGTDASALIFGDFSQLMVGLFGAADIMVDETTGGLAATTRIIMHQDIDVAIRHAASFAKTDEVSIAA